MNRKVLWAVLVIGLALVVTPLAMSLPSKAGAGEHMLGGFQPIMQPGQVKTTAYYYNNVFTPLGKVTPMMSAKNLAKFQAYLTGLKSLKLTPAQMAAVQQQFPAMAAMLAQMPAMERDFGGLLSTMQANTGIFSQVPAGLKHYGPLVSTMQANVDNYKQVNSLPSFRLFAWFFIVPGVLLALLAAYGLYGGALLERRHFPHHTRPTHA
ncbi:MAG TPA: hypothetical protein VF379_00575 [Gaiellaceae bacterium]|jgi:hypothetical protein